jgi:hypothetical protein
MPADSNMCAEQYCPRPFSFIWIDHIIAQQHHGETGPDNLALSCLRCNSHKGPNLSGYHPPNQEVTIRTVDADHPLVAAFQGRERKRGAKKGRRPILVLPGGENGGEDGDTAFLQPPPLLDID